MKQQRNHPLSSAAAERLGNNLFLLLGIVKLLTWNVYSMDLSGSAAPSPYGEGVGG